MQSNISEVLPAAFESLFPGFSLFTRLLSSYLHTDVSSYSGSLILFAVLSPFFGFILPRFLDNIQNVLLYFTLSTEIPYHDKLHSQFIQWMERNDSLSCSRRSIAKSKNAISLPWQNEDDEDTDEDPLAEQERFEKSRENFWLSLKEQQNIKPIRYSFPKQASLFPISGVSHCSLPSSKREAKQLARKRRNLHTLLILLEQESAFHTSKRSTASLNSAS